MKLHTILFYTILTGMGLGLVSSMQANFFNRTNLTLVTNAAQDKISTASAKIVSGLQKSLLYPSRHPIITSTAALSLAALGSAYLAHCHKNGKDWTSVIEESEQVTRYMLNQLGKPDKLMYWQNKPKKLGNWATAAEIMENLTEVYAVLKKTKSNGDKSEHDFIVRMKTIIEKEKKDLVKVINKLENCLAECRITPDLTLSGDQPAVKSNIVQDIISGKKLDFNYDSNIDFIKLSKKEAESINRDISKRAFPSLLNPYLVMRNFALPFEARAIREYWRMYQLAERLNALQYCLDQELQRQDAQVVTSCDVLEAR